MTYWKHLRRGSVYQEVGRATVRLAGGRILIEGDRVFVIRDRRLGLVAMPPGRAGPITVAGDGENFVTAATIQDSAAAGVGDGDEIVVYWDAVERAFGRRTAEFEDGRFERVEIAAFSGEG